MTYIVKRGDTLTAIAKAHNTTVEALVASNGIKNPSLIYTGQKLTIPVKETPQEKPTNNQLYNALITCLDAIEELPEFKTIRELLEG